MQFNISYLIALYLGLGGSRGAFSLSLNDGKIPSRRTFLTRSVGTVAAVVVGSTSVTPNALAAPEIFKTPRGIKYAVLQQPKSQSSPQKGDIVAIEYTGYLTDGTIFDATHGQGKQNALMFALGGNAVIEGINEMVQEMGVGQKVQAIIPPDLAFGDKGLCLESGECLIKPKSTLVYDIYLKKAAIPPP